MAEELASNSSTESVSACSGPENGESYNYNTSLHIVSLFVILVVSLLGASISVASVRIKALRIPSVVINVGKFFGTG
jgi:hypothetical protein